jgi:hypothetical protein
MPYVKLKFDGSYYGEERRKFFTGLGLFYRFSQLHVSGLPGGSAATNPTTLALLPFVDRNMHTVGLTLDVTSNVFLGSEISYFDEKRVDARNTEWLMYFALKF